jgi:hypothetical protein
MNQKELIDISWRLHYLKELLGLKSIRNDIVKKFLSQNDICFGETFGIETYDKVEKYCKIIMNPKSCRYLVFTATNPPDKITNETHYQSYVIDYKERKLYIFDPAKRGKGLPTYSGYITSSIVVPILRQNFQPVFMIPRITPQTNKKDTYCQTWSLWMVIQFFNENFDQPMDHKYMKLYTFYQEILIQFPKICTSLRRRVKCGRSCILPEITTEQQARFYLLENF